MHQCVLWYKKKSWTTKPLENKLSLHRRKLQSGSYGLNPHLLTQMVLLHVVIICSFLLTYHFCRTLYYNKCNELWIYQTQWECQPWELMLRRLTHLCFKQTSCLATENTLLTTFVAEKRFISQTKNFVNSITLSNLTVPPVFQQWNDQSLHALQCS